MEGQKVVCNNCKGIRHITTKFYDPNQTPRGNFLELIDPWKKWKWDCYNDEGRSSSSVPASLMCCPGCAAPMVKNGRLTIAPEPVKQKTQAEVNQEKINDETNEPVEENDLECKECGRKFKVKIALIGHMRSHQRSHKKDEESS